MAAGPQYMRQHVCHESPDPLPVGGRKALIRRNRGEVVVDDIVKAAGRETATGDDFHLGWRAMPQQDGAMAKGK